ncbi:MULTISPECIES: hypothetical protein [Marinobacter]|nr:hypothetical protein [Marinobacter salarius]WOI19674.1 hypothetical protein R1T46_02070 [Marinobacter salarius]
MIIQGGDDYGVQEQVTRIVEGIVSHATPVTRRICSSRSVYVDVDLICE